MSQPVRSTGSHNATTQDAAAAGTAQLTPSVRWVLASLSLSMLMPSLATSIANVGLPTLAQSFHASFQEVQWIVLAFLLTITTLIVSVGRLGDIVGRRRLLLMGICLFTVASLFCGIAPALWLLVAARAAQGLGAAIMMALTVAFAGEAVPKARTGSAMGLLGTMSAIGTTLGPSLGGLLIAGPGWRAIFLVNVPLGILNILLAHHYLPADRPESKSTGAGFDHLGTLLLTVTLLAYALAMTMGRGRFGGLNLALLLAAVLGACLFGFAEAKAASPLIRLTMFRDPVLSVSLAMSALVSTVMMSTLVVGPFYLSRALGLKAALVGAALSIGPLVAALTGVPAGRIVDRLGTQRMTIAGLSGVATGCAALAFMPARLGRRRVRDPDRRHYRRLCVVPGRQQHRPHDECPRGPAGRHFRHAQSVTQSRAHHRGICDGCGVRARRGGGRHHSGASRSYCDGHADHVRGRGVVDCRRTRSRGERPRCRDTRFAGRGRVLTRAGQDGHDSESLNIRAPARAVLFR